MTRSRIVDSAVCWHEPGIGGPTCGNARRLLERSADRHLGRAARHRGHRRQIRLNLALASVAASPDAAQQLAAAPAPTSAVPPGLGHADLEHLEAGENSELVPPARAGRASDLAAILEDPGNGAARAGRGTLGEQHRSGVFVTLEELELAISRSSSDRISRARAHGRDRARNGHASPALSGSGSAWSCSTAWRSAGSPVTAAGGCSAAPPRSWTPARRLVSGLGRLAEVRPA
jgi:hypothetical protein